MRDPQPSPADTQSPSPRHQRRRILCIISLFQAIIEIKVATTQEKAVFVFHEPSQIQFNLSPRCEPRISNIYSTSFLSFFGEIPEWLSISAANGNFLEGNAPFAHIFSPIFRIDICCFISFHQFSMFNGSLRTCNLFLSFHSGAPEAFVQKIAVEWRRRQFWLLPRKFDVFRAKARHSWHTSMRETTK